MRHVESATRNSSAYARRSDNTYCSDSANIRVGGYSCSCNHGYRGNPYLQGGCIDIDECLEKSHNCTGECRNTEGSYECYCPKGTTGNGRGTICAPEPKQIKVFLGIGLCFLIFLIASFWIYWAVKKRKFIKLTQRFFQQNGGFLLQQHINSHKGPITTKIFSEEELQRATNNFDESQIVGRGGYGTVYKGILTDQKLVAVKKSKFVDETQIEQFINEVFILSQINHRNVVKLLGCCLETQVPLLVYEFVSNGTLFHHIHDEGLVSSMALEDRLRVACETAGALAYLHSAASMPIFHRDVKSTNILLDDNLRSKVSDFGASRLVPLDQTQISTLVQGTLGYLDPEYFQTGQLTEKSDVYSFGVVLVELITGLKPICPTRTQENRNLSMCFISSMKEKQLFKILEHRVVNEGDVDQLTAIAELAARCLRLDGEERPTMKEVAMELEGIRRFKEQTWILKKHEKGQSFLQGEPFELDTGNHNATGQDSLGNSWNSRRSRSGAFVQDTLTSGDLSGMEIGR